MRVFIFILLLWQSVGLLWAESNTQVNIAANVSSSAMISTETSDILFDNIDPQMLLKKSFVSSPVKLCIYSNDDPPVVQLTLEPSQVDEANAFILVNSTTPTARPLKYAISLTSGVSTDQAEHVVSSKNNGDNSFTITASRWDSCNFGAESATMMIKLLSSQGMEVSSGTYTGTLTISVQPV